MATRKIPYLIEKKNPDGTVRHYWQPSSALRAAGWKPQRLPDDVNRADQMARELNEELAAWRVKMADGAAAAPGSPRSGRAGPPGTVRRLIHDYKTSKKYKRLEPKTREGYDWHLRTIDDWAGPEMVRAVTAKAGRKFYEAMFEVTPSKANAVMRVLRLLFEFARRDDVITVNPFVKPGLFSIEKTGKPWPFEAVDYLVEVADELGRPSIGDAILIASYLGQREGDMITLPRPTWTGDTIVFRQNKTNAVVELPIGVVPRLDARIRAIIERHKDDDAQPLTLIVSEQTGGAYKQDNFRAWFTRVRDAAAGRAGAWLVDYLIAGREKNAPDAVWLHGHELWFMHLRHTAVLRLSLAGCTHQQIAAITGWSQETVSTIIDTYLRHTTELARQGFEKVRDFDAARAAKAASK